MPETIGQRLKQARESRYLTVEKAAAETRIRSVFLQALEADDFSVMPSAAQGRGFLRNYADYLGLNIDEIIAELQASASQQSLEEVSGPLPQVNLLEEELPPLVNADEEPAPPFWKRWLGRRTPADSPPTLFEEPPSQPETLTETPLQAETMPGEDEQVEVQNEARTGVLARITSLFQFKGRQGEVQPIPEKEEEADEPQAQDAAPKTPTLPADIIFAEIGAQLRERRELISLTFEEVERHTKLRTVFVKALEEGSFEKLPSPVQTRGMLVNYATFLDMDVDAVLLRFADALQARRREKYAETPRENIQTQVNASMPFLRTYLAGDLLFGVLMISVLAALAIWGVGRLIGLQNDDPEPQAPSVAEVLSSLPTPTSTPLLDLDALPTATVEGVLPLVDTPLPASSARVSVSIFALERVFVRVSVDGNVEFEGRMAPREVKVFAGDQQVVILTGNAAALRITYNGQDLGLLGGTGEVVSRVYLETGVVTPTATIPPTPTNTPPVTPTFTPTVTPTATPAGQ